MEVGMESRLEAERPDLAAPSASDMSSALAAGSECTHHYRGDLASVVAVDEGEVDFAAAAPGMEHILA